MGRMNIGRSDVVTKLESSETKISPISADTILYVDRPVETIVHIDRPVETIKYIDRPVIQVRETEKIVFVDRPVEVVREVIREVIVEKPTTIHKIERVEIPVEKIVHVHDISVSIAQRKLMFQKNRSINILYTMLGVSVLANLMLILVMVGN